MTKILNIGFCVLAGLVVVSCRKAKLEKVDVEVVDLRRSVAELQVPGSLFHRLENMIEPESKAGGHGEGSVESAGEHGEGGGHEASKGAEDHGGGKGESGGGDHGGGGAQNKINVGGNMDFGEVIVYLTEATKGTPVLRHRNLKVEFAKGGGTVDLAEYLNPYAPGEFLFGLEITSSPQAKNLKAFYWSGANSQTVGAETYGLGCHKIADITSFYEHHLATGGVKVSSRRNMHVSQIVGTYILAYQMLNGRWRSAQVTIIDSSKPKLACGRKVAEAID